MRRCEQISAADWLGSTRTPWQQLVTFGPSGFDAYARVRYLPDPEFTGQRESDVSMPVDRPSDLEVARRALLHLARFTDTADECYFCVWDGYTESAAHLASAQGPLVTIPDRSYALFTASLNEIKHQSEQATIPEPAFPPAFVWPADRRWCFTSDVDTHWAGIGAERAAIDTLVAASNIDALHADPKQHPTPYA